MKKKIISILIAALLCLSVAGCGGRSIASENVLEDLGPETGTISMVVSGGPNEVALYDNLIADFQDKNPGITVEPVWYNSADAIYQDLISGIAPDVIGIDAQYFGGWCKAGALKSIQPFVDRDNYDLSDFWPELVKIGRYDKQLGRRNQGDLYGLPKDYGINGVYVNTTLVNKAVTDGLITAAERDIILDRDHPMTFETYVQMARKLTVVESSGAVKQYGCNGFAIEAYVFAHGSDLVKDGKYLNAEDPTMIAGYDLLASMCNPSSDLYCSPTYNDSQSIDTESLFQTGRVAMFFGGRWITPSFENTPFNWQCINMPVANEGDEPAMYCATALYGISRNCVKTGMAWKLIQYLASADAYRIMNQLNYAVPARKSLLEEDEFKDPTLIGSRMTAADAATFFRAACNAKSAPHYYFVSNRWIEILSQNASSVLKGEKNAATFLKDVESEINMAIKASDPSLFS